MSPRTSRMEAITAPERWGYEPVDVVFGEVRPRPDRVVTLKGECLRHKETGEVVEFRAREGASLEVVGV